MPKTILIAEDHKDTLFLLATNLRSCGYLVLETQDSIAALAQLKEKRPDLLILDIMMPGRSGFAVLEQLLEEPELRTIPVIVLSAE